jgi:hypothetical protein
LWLIPTVVLPCWLVVIATRRGTFHSTLFWRLIVDWCHFVYLCSIRHITAEVGAAVLRAAVEEDLAEGHGEAGPRELKHMSKVSSYCKCNTDDENTSNKTKNLFWLEAIQLKEPILTWEVLINRARNMCKHKFLFLCWLNK